MGRAANIDLGALPLHVTSSTGIEILRATALEYREMAQKSLSEGKVEATRINRAIVLGLNLIANESPDQVHLASIQVGIRTGMGRPWLSRYEQHEVMRVICNIVEPIRRSELKEAQKRANARKRGASSYRPVHAT